MYSLFPKSQVWKHMRQSWNEMPWALTNALRIDPLKCSFKSLCTRTRCAPKLRKWLLNMFVIKKTRQDPCMRARCNIAGSVEFRRFQAPSPYLSFQCAFGTHNTWKRTHEALYVMPLKRSIDRASSEEKERSAMPALLKWLRIFLFKVLELARWDRWISWLDLACL